MQIKAMTNMTDEKVMLSKLTLVEQKVSDQVRKMRYGGENRSLLIGIAFLEHFGYSGLKV